MRPLVLYHARCNDGFCAAWAAWCRYGREADYRPVQYGQAPPGPADLSGRHLYVLDFCYPHEALLAMSRACVHVTVLDHHKSRAPDMAGPYWREGDDAREGTYGHGTLVCHYHPDKSGGRLAWEHFHGGGRVPWLVDYTEDRDLWRWRLPKSRELNAALMSHPHDFALWDRLAGRGDAVERLGHEMVTGRPWDVDFFAGLAKEGEAILRYEAQQVEAICANAREVEVGGHRVLAACTSVLFSEVAGRLAEGRPFGAAWFVRADGRKQWSLRSREGGVDVSEVAKALGGGGHRNAAGFEE